MGVTVSHSSGSPRHRFRAGTFCALLILALATAAPVAAQDPPGTLDANTLGGTPSLAGQATISSFSVEAQTFVAGRSGSVLAAQVTMFFFAIGTPPTLPFAMEIRATDANGAPVGPALASTTVPASAITSVGPLPGTLVTGIFDDPAVVTAGERYALVLTTQSDLTYAIARDDRGDPYPDGQNWWLMDPLGWWGGPWGWYATNADMIFAIYISDPVTYESLASLTYEWVSKAGIANELAAILESAAAAEARGNLNAVAGKLEEFRALLKAQAGKSITVENAQTLINYTYEL